MPSPSDDPDLSISAEEASDAQRLQRLEALTDAALKRLDVEDLLPELLDRVRDLLNADTAAILLLDDSNEFLVATASRGLEEEVRQGSRVPMGRGFAGTIAQNRRAVILDEVNPASVVNPVLLRKGVRSMLGVPLVAGGSLLGVLHIGTLRQHTFTAEDVALLDLVADRAALAISTGRGLADRAAAAALQRSLSPPRLPDLGSFELAGRYVPGGEYGVGGDWYDAFLLPSGQLGLVIGDVMGHGLRAATIMGRFRSALRAYAFDEDDPARVLEKLDRKIQHFEPGQMATVIYALVEPGSGRARLSSAGHLPPLLARPGAPARFLELPNDIPLGVDTGAKRDSTTVELPVGGLLCLFTDGLVERRDQDLDKVLHDLRSTVALCAASPPDAVCAQVMAEIVGDRHAEDDIALLIVGRRRSEG